MCKRLDGSVIWRWSVYKGAFTALPKTVMRKYFTRELLVVCRSY